MVIFLFAICNMLSHAGEVTEVYFYGNSVSEEAKEYWESSKVTMANIIFENEKTDKCIISTGMPIEVIGAEECYMIPICVDSCVKYIAHVSYVDGQYMFSFSENMSDYFNDIKPGYYFLFCQDDETYLVDEKGMAINLMHKENSKIISLDNAHNGHCGQNVYNCAGGSISDAYNVIYYATMKTGNIQYTNNAATLMPSIMNNVPVFMELVNASNGTGHAAVASGYYFDNTNGQFTYVICDSNSSSYVYQTVPYTDASFTYTPSAGVSYSWVGGIYGWH